MVQVEADVGHFVDQRAVCNSPFVSGVEKRAFIKVKRSVQVVHFGGCLPGEYFAGRFYLPVKSVLLLLYHVEIGAPTGRAHGKEIDSLFVAPQNIECGAQVVYIA